MACDKCGAASSEQYDFFLEIQDNPFDEKAIVLGRSQASLCRDCIQRHRKRTMTALIVAICLLVAVAIVRFVVWTDAEPSIVDLFGLGILLATVFGIRTVARQSDEVMGQHAATWLSRELSWQGVSLLAAKDYPLHRGDNGPEFENLPVLGRGDRVKAVMRAVPKAAPATDFTCDFCRSSKSDSLGLEFPLVAAWVRSRSGMGIIEHSYYGFKPVSTYCCQSCIEREPVDSVIRRAKKIAAEKGREAIAHSCREGKRILDSESVIILTWPQFELLQVAGTTTLRLE